MSKSPKLSPIWDGGFTMMMGEMLSLKQLNLPVKVFVFNNEELSFIAMEMKASGT